MKKMYSKPTLSVFVKAESIHASRRKSRGARAFLLQWLEEGRAVKHATKRQIEALTRMHSAAGAVRPARK